MRKMLIFISIILLCLSYILTNENVSQGKVIKKDSLMWYIDTPGEKNYEDANNYCNNLKAEGYSDWHLPSLNELRTIFVGCEQVKDPSFCDLDSFVKSALKGDCSCKGKTEIKLDKLDCHRDSIFDDKQCSKYWTNTMLRKSCEGDCPFFIDFVEGSIVSASPLNKYNFLCVREIKKKDKKESK